MRTDSDCDAPAALVGPNVASFVAGRSHDPAAAEPTASLVDGTALCRRSAPGPRAVTANRGTFGWRPPPMECPEENIFVDFVRGELAKPERARLETHLDGCDACSMVVAEMARLFGSDISDDALPELEPEPDFNDGRADLLDTDGAFSPTAVTETSGEILPEPAAMLPQGAKLGRYVVIDRVGAGGMGVVYAAYDPELDRKVALKVLRRGILGGGSGPGSKQRDRLMREAQAMAKLSHPNVITVHDVGTFEDQVFLAMEFIDGQTLGAWLAETSRTWREILRVFVAAGKGLAAAHAVGLVHRDFKPDNVLLGNDGRVLVTDFGLARPAAGQTGSFSSVGEIPSQQVLTASLTQTGALVGTPAYMAPEQLRAEPLDGRADQYAFGVALFEALHGRRPDEPTPSRPRRWPRWLDDLVARTRQPDPDDRFPSMEAVLDALTRDRKAPLRVGLAVGGLVAMTGVGFLAATRQPAAVPASDPCAVPTERIATTLDPAALASLRRRLLAGEHPSAEASAEVVERTLGTYAERWTAARRDACEATWVRHEQSPELLDRRMHCLDARLTAVDSLLARAAEAEGLQPHRVVSAAVKLPPVEACNDTERLLMEAPPPAEPETALAVERLRSRLAAAKADADLGHFDRALSQGESIVSDAELLEYPVVLAKALSLVANQQRERGDSDLAVQTLERALHEAQAAGADRLVVQLLASLAHEEGVVLERDDAGRRWLAQARAVLRRVGDDLRLTAFVDNEQGTQWLAAGRFEQARDSFENVLSGTVEAYGTVHPWVGGAHINLGLAYKGLRDYPAALEHFDAARATMTSVYGPAHPAVAVTWLGRGAVLSRQQDFAEAERAYRGALEVFEVAIGPDSIDAGRALASVANVRLGLDDFETAREYYLRSLEIFETLSPTHSLVGRTLSNIGGTYSAQGHCDDALPYFEQALRIKLAGVEAQHPVVLGTLLPMIDCLLDLERYEQALPLTQTSLEIRDLMAADSPAGRARTLAQRGRAQRGLGHRAAALESLEEALRLQARDTESPSSNPTVDFELAQLLVKKDPARARALAERAAGRWRDEGDVAAAKVGRWLDALPAVR